MKPVDVTHIGGPTVKLQVAGLTFLTDPTLDPPGTYPMPVGQLEKREFPGQSFEELSGQVDVVLLSHDEHPDNLDRAGRRLLEGVDHVFSTPSAANRIRGVRGLEPWACAHVTGPEGDLITITAVPARHGPAALEAALGEVTGFLLEGPSVPTIYVSGDNAGLENVAELARRTERIDLAVVSAGAPQLPQLTGPTILGLASADVADVAAMLGDAQVLVVHTEGWSHFTETPADAEKAACDRGLADRVRVPTPGASLLVGLDESCPL